MAHAFAAVRIACRKRRERRAWTIDAPNEICQCKHKATNEPKSDVAKNQQPVLIDTTRKTPINGRVAMRKGNEFCCKVAGTTEAMFQLLNKL